MAHSNLQNFDIIDVNDSNALRVLNNFVDLMATERSVYITAKRMRGYNNPNLSSTRFRCTFLVYHTTLTDTDPTSETRIHSSYLMIHYPFERFASADEAKAVVTTMVVSNPRFPFYVFDSCESGQSLLWEEFPAYDNGSSSSAVDRVPLQRLDDMITMISEAAVRIARETSESECNVVQMAIVIKKRTVIPHQHYEMVRMLMNRDDDNGDDGGGSDNDDDDHDSEDDDDEPEMNGVIEQSFAESAMLFGSVPAAKSAVEALEKFKYEGRCEGHEDEAKLMIETCVMCMEEVMIGSHLTRMPCSHLFHEDCISKWLHWNHTCPLCRFKLPS